MNTVPFTNTTEDGQFPELNLDANTDYFLVTDYNNDKNYWNAKICEAIKYMSGSPLEDFQIIFGGIVSDADSGKINISEGAAIGKDDDGNFRIITIPSLSNVSLPSGWNNNEQIWIVGKYKVKLHSATRQHFNGTEYQFQLLDSYLGDGNTDELFVHADDLDASMVKWGSFKMNGTTFSYVEDRSTVWIPNNTQLQIGDYKWSDENISPSPAHPWFKTSEDHTFSQQNWVHLVGNLRGKKLSIGGVTEFEVSGFTTGTTTRLQLTDTLTNRNLIRTLLEDYQYSKSYQATTNSDGNDDDSAFSSWGYIVRISASIGSGGNAPTANQEFRIKYLSSLANTLSVTNRYICVDKDTSSSATTGTGKIEIYPYRIASGGTPNENEAKWRKIPESGLMTPGSVFYSGTDLIEVPTLARVRDRFQGFVIQGVSNGGSAITPGGSIGTGGSLTPSSDGSNGDLRKGPSSRSRSHIAYLYRYGGTYRS